MTVPHAARTDVGRRREHNEDSYLVELPVLAVADGVGGSAKGEVASSRALETFAAHAPSIVASRSGDDAVRAMHEAVLAANVAVHEAHRRDESLRGMATTLTAAVLRDGGELVVGHVGDSRLYVCSAAGARLVTDDHSVVAELVRSGQLDADEAAHHPQRNVITRAIGQEGDVAVDAFVSHVGPGDWILLASDGLTEHVADGELATTLLAHPGDPQAAVDALVDLANERGGTDNITVVVAQPVPSDVSGELRIEALRAAGGTETFAIPVASTAPAQASGPLPAVQAEATVDDELPALEPIRRGTFPTRRARSRGRGWWIVALVVAAAIAIAAVLWSQSYFLVVREDGRVGINHGFPVARLATPHRSSDVLADELDAADRERLVDSHRILDREDAERVLTELEQRVAPVSAEGEANGIAPGP